jgi:hypothetical protein
MSVIEFPGRGTSAENRSEDEAAAAIYQEAKPPAACRSLETAEAVTANGGRGLRSAPTRPPAHVGR